MNLQNYTDKDLFGFFIGSYLGDGCFSRRDKSHNTYIVFKHSENQLDYLTWKYNYLKQYWLVREDQKIKPITLQDVYANAQKQFTFSTKTSEYLNEIKESTKKEVIQNINEMAFAIWVLDDGGFYNNGVKISCGSLTQEEKELLNNIINEKLNINSYLYKHPTNEIKDYIRITTKNEFAKVIDIIKKKNINIKKIKEYL